MQKVVDWFKRFGGWLLLAVAVVASLYYRRTDRGARIIQRAREMQDRALEAREHAARVLGENDAQIKEIDSQLANLRRATVESISGVKGLTDDQVIDRFRALGL